MALTLSLARSLGCFALLVASFVPALSAAEQPGREDRSTYEIRRPHTIAEAEFGVIALPNAPISAGRRGGDTPIIGKIGNGDATLLIGMHLLYRGDPRWMIGASALFGPSPTTDTGYGGRSDLERTHARNYFWIGGEARYYPLRVRLFEGYVGASVGGVVVADRYSNASGETAPPIYGEKSVTVRSEGFSAGLLAGLRWNFAHSWGVGFSLRVDQWILPTQQACTPVGDCSTLSGGVLALGGGLVIGYRIPL